MKNESVIWQFKTSYDIKKSSDHNFFANIDNKVNVWDAQKKKRICSFNDIKHPSSIAFSYNSKYLAAKNTSGRICLYNLDEMNNVMTVQPSSIEGTNILFTPDDKFILTTDWDGNIFLVDYTTHKIKLLKKYENCMVEMIDYDHLSNRFTFLISQKRKDKYKSDVFDDYNILLECPYPFDEYNMKERKIDCTIWKIKFNNFLNSYIAINKDKLISYDNNFEITNSRALPELSTTMNIDWSSDGSYILVLCGSVVQIIDFKSFEIIKTFEIKFARFFEFVEEDNDKRILCGTISEGYYIDFNILLEMSDIDFT